MGVVQKLALVVDDSNSARMVMGRMLEKLGLGVNTVESAAAALSYLTRHTPDIILMDHMMPDMDGFEAVKAIKSNPETATIPIMMYTSKGGDLYLGQARALGAVGILPKTVAPAELLDTLKRIGIMGKPEAKEQPQPTQEKTGIEAIPETDTPEIVESAPEVLPEPAVMSDVQADTDLPVAGEIVEVDEDAEEVDHRIRRLLLEQRVELYNDLLLSVDSFSDHLSTKINEELVSKIDEISTADSGSDEKFGANSPLPIALLVMFALSVIWNITHLMQSDTPAPETTSYVAEGSEQKNVETLLSEANSREQLTAERASELHKTLAWAINQSMNYPYNELALDNQRVDLIMELLDRLSTSGFEGKVVLETHVGEFCMMGNQDGGYTTPGAASTINDCDFTGNPVQATDLPTTHQSLRFANYMSNVEQLYDNNISLEVVASARENPLYAYPVRSSATLAQNWNKAAARNNHVNITLTPYPVQY